MHHEIAGHKATPAASVVCTFQISNVARAGAEKIFDLGQLSQFEQAGLKDLIPELKDFEFGCSGY